MDGNGEKYEKGFLFSVVFCFGAFVFRLRKTARHIHGSTDNERYQPHARRVDYRR